MSSSDAPVIRQARTWGLRPGRIGYAGRRMRCHADERSPDHEHWRLLRRQTRDSHGRSLASS